MHSNTYINAAKSTVYLVDPAHTSTDQAHSDHAAKRACEYFKMQRACHGKTDWVDVKLKGNVMLHLVQQDGSSCGVIVIKAEMEAFPEIPKMAFGTTKKEMSHVLSHKTTESRAFLH